MYSKEVAGALLYCGGIFLPSYTFKERLLHFFDWMAIAQFFLIVLVNLILFSLMDYDEDSRDQHPSLATQIGKNGTRVILILMFSLQFLLTGYTILMGGYLGFIYLLMESVLLALFLYPGYFKRDNRYRFYGDAIFFFPILLCEQRI
jgi:4-hydroxybenzoate polyprenyltransferase